MKQGQDSHNVLLHRENHAFRLSDLPPAAITSVCSFWQDHRLAGGAGKIYLRLELFAITILLQGRWKYICPLFSEAILKPLSALLPTVAAERLGCLTVISTSLPIQSEEQHFVDGS